MKEYKSGDKVRYIPNEKYHGHFAPDAVTILDKHDGGYWVAFDGYAGDCNCFLAADSELGWCIAYG